MGIQGFLGKKRKLQDAFVFAEFRELMVNPVGLNSQSGRIELKGGPLKVSYPVCICSPFGFPLIRQTCTNPIGLTLNPVGFHFLVRVRETVSVGL